MKCPPFGVCMPVTYVRTVDGDGPVVKSSLFGNEIKLRLIDTWCAEVRGNDPKEKAKGLAASKFTRTVLEDIEAGDGELVLAIPGSVFARGFLKALTFDRIPAYLFVSSDRTLNEMLVEAGHATKEKEPR